MDINLHIDVYHKYINMSIRMNLYIYAYTKWAHTYKIYTFIYEYVNVYINMYIHTFIYIFICMYIYIYIHIEYIYI
jgi:hypothetical protein